MNRLDLLKKEYMLSDEEIEILNQLPDEEKEDFLIERKIRVTLMQILIEMGEKPDKAKEVLTEPGLVEIVDEKGFVHRYH